MAAEGGRLEVCKKLIELTADPNAVDSVSTPLVAFFRIIILVRFLLITI